MLNLLNWRHTLRQRLRAVAAVVAASAGCCVCGLLMTFVLAPRQALEASSVARLPQMSAVEVAAAEPGETVLVTGVLAGNAPLRAGSALVVHKEEVWTVTVPNDEDGAGEPYGRWSSRAITSPALTLAADGQSLRLHPASGIQLSGALADEIVPGDSALTASDSGEARPDGTTRYRGLADGEQATVLGEKAQDGGVTPEHIFGGDRAGFEASQRQAASNLLISGIFSLVMAPIVLIGGLLAALFWRRR